MKFRNLLSIFVVITFLFISSLSVLAQEQPPSLENHQFYGAVYWDKTAKEPTKVIATVGTSSFSSSIKKEYCGDKTCTGSYGKDSDNILRVQATTGVEIKFYLDTLEVWKTTYAAGSVTVHDINVAKNPIEKSGCTSDWKCTEWSACTGGKQSQSCTDQNKCNPDEVTKTETRDCSTGSIKKGSTPPPIATAEVKCYYQWDCSEWGSCLNNQQTRQCSRIDDCDAQFAAKKVPAIVEISKPAELKSCISGVTGALPPKSEEAVMSPPPTPPAVKAPIKQPAEEKEEAAGISVWVYVGIAVIIIGVIGLWLMMRRKKEAALGGY